MRQLHRVSISTDRSPKADGGDRGRCEATARHATSKGSHLGHRNTNLLLVFPTRRQVQTLRSYIGIVERMEVRGGKGAPT